MSLKPTPLMDFQVHCTIAQKIVSDHNSFGHPIDTWKLILHTRTRTFIFVSYVYNLQIHTS